MEPIKLAHFIVDRISEKKGEDIVLLDMRDVSVMMDYFIICNGNSNRQIRAILQDVRAETKDKLSVFPSRIEGKPDHGWVLADYGGVVVHIFSAEKRSYYDLEQLWQDANVLVKMQ